MSPKTKFELKPGPATREAFGRALVELGRENENVVVVDADLSKSTMTTYFAKEFPDRFFSMGIAEANMIGVGAGLAMSGKIPFVASFSVFANSLRSRLASISFYIFHAKISLRSVLKNMSPCFRSSGAIQRPTAARPCSGR